MQYFIVFEAFKALSYWVYIFVQWLL